MGFFDFLKRRNINQGVQNFYSESNAYLLDVRTPDEYEEEHIPGSRNLPLYYIDRISSISNQKDLPLYVYCHSGSRSRKAAAALKQMGYTNIINLGGMINYSGKVETGK